MAFDLHITAGGLLRPYGLSGEPEKSMILSAPGSQQGNASFLITLASLELQEDAGQVYNFFRDLTRSLLLQVSTLESGPDHDREIPDFLTRICGEFQQQASQLSDALPPCPGSERADTEWFCNLFRELTEFIAEKIQQEQCSAAQWVRQLSPQWKDIGKICFHLAENKEKNPERPFVFLATYIHQLSKTDQAAHLPLSLALKRFANDRNTLIQILQPLKKAAENAPLLQKLFHQKTLFQPTAFSSFDAWHFLKEFPVYQDHGIIVRFTDLWHSSPPKLKVAVQLDFPEKHARLAADTLVNFSVSAAIGNQNLTPEELQQILNTGGGLIRIKGQWIEADTERVAALLKKWQEARELSEFGQISLLQSLKLLNGAYRLTDGIFPDPGGDSDIFQVNESADFQTLHRQLEQKNLMAENPPIPGHLNSILRPYQQKGVAFLWNMTRFGLGVCLADDMGLGKTLQILVWLEILRLGNHLTPLPALLVLPASLLGNWKGEVEKFTPDLHVKILHPSEMNSLERQDFEQDPADFLQSAHLVITTYQLLPKMLPFLQNFTFPAIVADEAQMIKNADSQQSRALRSLKGSRRVVLTGTPVENSIKDLWSLFDFIMPGLLGNMPVFRDFIKGLEQDHKGHIDYSPLRKLIRPCILRRLKSDRSIIRDLPDKTEVKAYCHLTPLQANFYQRAVEAMKKDLESAGELQKNTVILSYLMHFKQICNHPSQFSGNQDYDPKRSGKFLRLIQLAEQIAAAGEKMLIFTQFREMTEPLHELLSQCFGRTGLIIHGGTPVKKRQEAVALFQSEDGPPFFVLSLKAAGTGLNLTAANHVVHFDRWWNPAVENQATDRAYRIGQRRNVLVHKFVVKGTIEERIDALISGKKYLADSLLRAGPEKLLMDMSPEELLRFSTLSPSALHEESETAEDLSFSSASNVVQGE